MLSREEQRQGEAESCVRGLTLVELDHEGKLLKTGEPVTFDYIRNTEKAPYLGERFQQDIEPAGKYILFVDRLATPIEYFDKVAPGKWESGTASFKNPLVIRLTKPDEGPIYDESSWKAQLHRAYGKKGKALTKALIKDGYDGVITISMAGPSGTPSHPSEIVCLRPESCKKRKCKCVDGTEPCCHGRKQKAVD